MSIHFDVEKQAWSLENITQEELEQLHEMGKQYLITALGANLLSRLQQSLDAEASPLGQLNPDEMGQA